MHNSKLKIKYQGFEKAAVLPLLLYYKLMINEKEKLGAFIVPTGIGASIGGYAGDASVWARRFAQHFKLIVNPNVVNAGGFSGITANMFYIEGYSLDEFFKGNLFFKPSGNNKIGVVFDCAIPQDVLNIHINTINAVKTVYGVDVIGFEITDEPAGVEFSLDKNGVSSGSLKYPKTLLRASEKLLARGADAIAIVCFFEDPEGMNEDYAQGSGTDPVGGVEAIISHYISKELKVPCAHSPAFEDYSISVDIINPKAAAEYITPTFLPCILLGLSQAPLLSVEGGISVENLDFLVMPADALGAIPVFEALKRNIPIYAVMENSTALDVTNEKLFKSGKIIEAATYQECLNLLTQV